MSEEAFKIFQRLCDGQDCYPPDSIYQELGSEGLIYKTDWKAGQIALTEEGLKCCKERP